MWLLRILKLVALLTPFVPARVGYLACQVSGFIFYLGNFRARRNVMANLRHVMPDRPWLARQTTALQICITVVTNYYDLIRLRSVERESFLDNVGISGLEHIEDALRDGRGAIIVSGHIGNFSVMARLPGALGIQAAVIAEKVEPPQLFNYMGRLRSAMGIEVIPPGSPALRKIIRVLKHNGVLLLASDRDVSSQGVRVTFFGRETRLPAGPVALSMKTGAALIPAVTLRDCHYRSSVAIEQPIELAVTGDWEHDLHVNVQRVAHCLEQMILRDPGQWAVLQRVWPPTSDYGRSEALGSADDVVSPRSRSESRTITRSPDESHARTLTTL